MSSISIQIRIQCKTQFGFKKLISAVSAVFLWLTIAGLAAPARAAEPSSYTYAGLEYFGSSQMTRQEVESALHLKPGASSKAVERAAENFKAKIDKSRLMANVEIVSDPPDRLFVVIDFIDPCGAGMPYRSLTNPHHVMTKSEKPEMLLRQLRERLAYLDEQGRAWSDSYPGGVRMFSDEAANQIVNELRKYGQVMREEWLETVASDPDAQLRCQAIELLNWGGQYVDTSARLIASLDDTDHRVRGSVVRFLFPRMSQLPDEFPWTQFAAALTRQMKRPSHEDRVKSISALLLLMKLKPLLIGPIMNACQKDAERFSKDSQITTLRKLSREMLMVFAQPLPRPPAPIIPEPGF